MKRILSFFIALALSSAVSVSYANTEQAFGIAGSYNLFVLEDFVSTSSDVQGKLAAGRHVQLDSYSVASTISSAPETPTLVVGGDLTYGQGKIFTGSALVAGSIAGVNQTVIYGLESGAEVLGNASISVDFATEFSKLAQLSKQIAAVEPTGTVEYRWGGIYVTGDCNSSTQVFNLSGSTVLDSNHITLNCVPSSATIVFNIDGTRAGFKNIGLSQFHHQAPKILYNFHQATVVEFTWVGVEGTVLAPLAHLDNPRGQVNGTVIAKSWNGPMELHHFPFQGDIGALIGSSNSAPIAQDQSISIEQDVALSIELVASDEDADLLEYEVLTQPTGGLLTGTAPNLVYSPTAGFSGSDSFNFKVTDGALESNVATVSIVVVPVNKAPVADNKELSTDEDQIVDVLLSGADAEGNSLTYEIVEHPTNGELSGTLPNLRYLPQLNFSGEDSFKYRVNDGELNSELALVSITVEPVNDAPNANPQALQVNEDVTLAIELTAADVDNDTLVFQIASSPQNGVVTGTAPSLIYNPNQDFTGSDSFTFSVSDGELSSDITVISISVVSVNDAPIAQDESLSTDEDVAVNIVLNASDIDGDGLTFELLSQPQNGVLSGSTPNLTFTPNANFNGNDSFTFRVSDGSLASDVSQVSISVTAINDAPVAGAQTVVVDEDSSVQTTLVATDVDGDTLSYTVATPPENGVLSGDAPDLIYQPNADFNGTDSFTYFVSDGLSSSETIEVGITINSINDRPEASDQSLTLDEDASLSFDLITSDVDGDVLNYEFVAQPASGVLSGSAPNLVYTPNANFSGSDSFQYIATDGVLDSNIATVSIAVAPINDVPTADGQSLEAVEDNALLITLTGEDLEGATLTFDVFTEPQFGTVSGTGANISYQPNENYAGTDSFTFRVNDGDLDSAPATISINVAPVNDAPVAENQTITVDEDSTIAATLTALDIEGDPLSFTVVTQPSNGSLSNSAPDLVYTPNANFNGVDTFSFRANDGESDSDIATVEINVNAINDVPTASNQSFVVEENTATTLLLLASDIEGDPLTFNIVTAPERGTLSGDGPNFVYTPEADYGGSDSFTYVLNDGAADSAIVTVSLTVNSSNQRPTAAALSVEINEDETAQIVLNGTDPDGDVVSYSVESQPSNGVLSGIAPDLIYTPNANFNGSDSFTYRVNDGVLSSEVASVEISVLAANDAPVANGQSVTVDEDTQLVVLLTGFDADADALDFVLQTQPTNGALSGAAPNLVYLPNPNFNGADSFTFVVDDGELDSVLATVAISVNAVNDAPAVSNQDLTTNLGDDLAITLQATDLDGDPLTYAIEVPPANGALTGDLPTLNYTPNAGFTGSDSFTYIANDGFLDSAVATITISVEQGNQAPVIVSNPLALTTVGVLYQYQLLVEDADNDVLNFSLTESPPAMLIDASSGLITWTPDTAGDFVVTVLVDDGAGGTAEQSYSLMVAEASPQISSEATDFWLMFNINNVGRQEEVARQLFVTSQFDAQITIDLPGLGVTQTHSVTAGSIETIDLTAETSQLNFNDIGLRNGAIHVTSDNPIVVYLINRDKSTTDAAAIIPTVALGRDYVVASHAHELNRHGSFFGFVAIEDNTTVSFTPTQQFTADGIVYAPNVLAQLVLETGQTFQAVTPPVDFSGSTITSDKPVAVFSGSNCTAIRNETACDHLVEQLLPAGSLGSQFYSVPLAERLNGDTFRFYGVEDDTLVSLNGDYLVILNRGEFYELLIEEPSFISASKPLQVMQYSNSNFFDQVKADPFMVTVPPAEQFLNSYVISAPEMGFSRNYVNIVALDADKSSVMLDGQPIDSSLWTQIANSEYVGAQIAVTLGAHTVTSNQAIGVYSYGYDDFDSYGYLGGLALSGDRQATGISLTLEPNIAMVGQGQVCVQAAILDSEDDLIPRKQVRFQTDNPVLNVSYKALRLTASNGVAEYCIERGGVSIDTVTVSVDGLTDTIDIGWLAFDGSENRAPVIESSPEMYASLRDTYVYQVVATDPNNDALIFALTERPEGMSIDESSGEIRWSVPNAFIEGWVTAVVTDPAGETDTQRYRLSFNPQDNHNPVYVLPQQQIVAERNYAEVWGEPDLDDNEPVTYTLVSGPAGFTVTPRAFSRQATINWAPTLADVGVHPIEIRLEDARGGQTLVEYELTVTENLPPIFTSLPPSTSARVGGLYVYEIATDDPDGDLVSVDGVVPQGASLSLSLGRYRFSWRPEPIQAGLHEITLTARDNFGGEAEQTFTIDVGVNQAPTFTTTPEFTARAESSYLYDFRAADPDGDNIVYSLLTAPDGMVRQGTRLSWTPTMAQIGEHDVVLQADDQQGQVVTQSFAVTVSENRAPAFTSLPTVTAVDSHRYSYRARAIDPDGTGPIYALATFPAGMTIQGANINWTPTPAQVGSHDVVVTADDRDGAITEQGYSILVTENRAPVFRSLPIVKAVTQHNYLYDLTAIDPEADSILYTLGTAPDGMSLVNRRISWVPTSSQLGEHAVEVIADDRFGKTSRQNFVLAVFENQNPVVTREPISYGRVVSAYFSRVRATDPDGDSVRYNLISGPAGLTVSSIGDIRWAAGDLQVGAQDIVLEASDQFGGVVEYRYTLTIVDNQLAITKAPNDGSLFVGEDYQFDVDALHPQSAGITYEFVSAPTGASISATSGLIEWTPTASQTGAQAFTVRAFAASDGLQDTASFSLNVESDTNQTPVITSSPVLTGHTNSQYVYVVTATDADNDALQYSLVAAPNGMTVNNQTGAIMWTLSNTASLAGTYTVTVRVTDENGKFAEQTYELQIDLFDFEPRITSLANEFAKLGFSYQYAVIASDANGDALTYALSFAPAGMTMDNSGLIQWTPTELGTFPVELVVSDGTFETVQLFSVTVNPNEPNLSASIDLTPRIVDAGQNTRIDVTASNNTGRAFATIRQDGVDILTNRGVPFSFSLRSDLPGDHAVEVVVTDRYQTVTVADSFRVRDNNDAEAPLAEITNIATDQIIISPIDVIGSVEDANLASWQLVITERNSVATEFTVLAEGTNNFSEQVITRFDPSLERNGQYAFVLIAKDENGLETQSSVSFIVDEDLKVGNFSIAFEDLNIPLAGIPISVRRTYDSRDRRKSRDFGFGWSLDYQNEESRTLGLGWSLNEYTSGPFGLIVDYCVEPLGSPIVTVTLPNGDIEQFEVSASPRCTRSVPNRNVSLEFIAIGDTQSTLESSGGAGYLNGENLTLDITSSVLVNPSRYQMTSKADYVFDLDQDFGLRKVTDPNGNTLTYSNEGIIHSDGKRVDFTRDAFGRITRITDPAGQTLNYSYDNNGDLAGATDRDTAETTFTYNRSHGLIDIMDPLGRNVVKNIYNDAGRLIAQEDSDGNRTEFNHDLDGRESVITDRNGNTSFVYYDDEGNVTSQIDALGNTTTFTHDVNGNQLSEVNAMGYETVATFNDRNDQLTQTDALGNITAFAYDQRGKETQITDARGNVFNNVYDTVGNLLTVTDPQGNVAGNNINRHGLPSKTLDVLGNETNFTYDVEGNKLTETDAEGHLMSFVYDANNNVVSETRTRLIEGVATLETTTYEYDARDRVIKTTDALGNESQTEYDAIGNEVAQIDALGRRTEMTYDAYSRLLSTTYPDGTSQQNNYDPEGNLLTETDRLGRTTTHVYDALNRLVNSTQADGSITSTEYDAIGRVAAEVDANGNRTAHAYDAADRRISTTDAQGDVTVFAYDGDGNMIGMTDANGHSTSYVYNELDQKVQTTFHDGSTMLEGLDALSRKISMTDQAGVTTNYEYDKLGRLTKVIDALSQETSYTYDSQGNKLTQTDAEGRTTRWSYDALGRVISRTLPLGQTESMKYDAVGNVTQSTDFNGQITSYSYDVNNRITGITYENGLSETFSYDAIGNRTQATKTENGDTSTWNYTYDNLNRLSSETQFTGTADEVTLSYDYDYDAQGNRTTLTETTDTQSRVTRYTFDTLNRLKTVQDPDGNSTTYDYDAVGNRIGMSHQNGIQTDYVYDELNRLTRLSHKDATNVTLKQFDYTLLANGKRAKIEESNGRTTDYTYDNLYRLTTEAIFDPVNANHNAAYTYDQVGNRTFEVVNGVSTQYTVDANDRLVQTGGKLYTHDAQGNTLTETLDGDVTHYTYNAKHELISSSKAGAATVYLYNADRIRIGKGDATKQSLYTIDNNRSYAQVLAEKVGGATAVNYTYGDDLVSQARGADVSTYHYDGLGSTRALSDNAGALTDTYDYEAFGEVLNQTGSTENDYLFTGEQFDSGLDQYYLRARYYDQRIGRFTQMDTWMGNNSDPVTLHKYLYANVDPVNMVDPTGNFASLGGFSAGFSVGGILAAANIASTAYSVFSIATGDQELSAKALATEILLSRVGGPAAQKIIGMLGKKSKEALRKGFDTVGCFFNSFPEGTLVHTEQGLVSIENIKIGDKVLAYDEATNSVIYEEVTHLIQNDQEYKMVQVMLKSGEVIEATPEHPFFTESWIGAAQLNESDRLKTISGSVAIQQLAYDLRKSKVYNLTVNNAHTYYVGESGVLVHNMNKNTGCKLRGIKAKGFKWDDILRKHSPGGRTNLQRTRANHTAFEGLTDRQIKARVKGGWKNRELRKTQTSFNKTTGKEEIRHYYEGVDPKSGQTLGIYFNRTTQIVETAFPVL